MVKTTAEDLLSRTVAIEEPTALDRLERLMGTPHPSGLNRAQRRARDRKLARAGLVTAG